MIVLTDFSLGLNGIPQYEIDNIIPNGLFTRVEQLPLMDYKTSMHY